MNKTHKYWAVIEIRDGERSLRHVSKEYLGIFPCLLATRELAEDCIAKLRMTREVEKEHTQGDFPTFEYEIAEVTFEI